MVKLAGNAKFMVKLAGNAESMVKLAGNAKSMVKLAGNPGESKPGMLNMEVPFLSATL